MLLRLVWSQAWDLREKVYIRAGFIVVLSIKAIGMDQERLTLSCTSLVKGTRQKRMLRAIIGAQNSRF